jgi:molybdopterin-containing oxidoreductase family iron-sulfur binding subunit
MNPRKDLAPELAALEERLGDTQGRRYWRSLEELAGTEAFQELMHREFPDPAGWPGDALSRRQFLTLMGASLALAGLGGCSIRPAPETEIVPYVRAPEEIIPGRPLFYATAMTVGGTAVGLLVESHQGRPTKIEGNPNHPASLGATDLFNQASVLTLYDPDRSQTVTYLGKITTWGPALSRLPVEGTASRGARVTSRDSVLSALLKLRRRHGAGLRILTETVVSPTLAWQLENLLQSDGFREARWHQYEPVHQAMAHRGAVMAFGRPINTYYRFYDLDKKERTADIVLSLDADFLTCGPGNLRYVAEFMAGRRVRTNAAEAKQAAMNRLYMVETAVSSTGAKADHRLALRAHEIEGFARALAARLGIRAAGGGAAGHERWIQAVADDLGRHRGRCVVLAGERQPAVVHLLAHALNQRLDNVGKTVFYTQPVEARPVDQLASLRELAEDLERGRVEMLLVLGGNPVYTAPGDYHFVERMQKVPLRVHLSLYQDETSRQCHWHLPETHFLEAWSDTRAHDGTASIVQPLIEPLYRGRSAHELLSVAAGWLRVPGYDTVRDYWRNHLPGQQASAAGFEDAWQKAVHDGVVAGTAFPHRDVALQDGWERHLRPAGGSAEGGLEIVFQADPTVYDGRFANNGWLQELPKPVTELAWGNAALMSPATAKQLDVWFGSYGHGGEHGSYHQPVVELTLGRRSVLVPIWIMPGHADHSITLTLGYGREHAGKVGGLGGQMVGANAYRLRTSDRPWFAAGLAVRKTGDTEEVCCTQQHHSMENREVVRTGTLMDYHRHPRFALDPDKEEEKEQTRVARKPLTLYEPYDYGPPKHRWGMVIDLTACTGCKACVVACQAENNIPVVGKEQVAFGREMHWLRVDRYISGPFDRPREFHFQPVPCMHCENAPCEYVCPVEATVHSAEGLNDMVYQRCVGTRFCSNNCPYKVRRFNFFHYSDYQTPSLRLQYNPDVTVRSRGVMEKCSYCVQRLRQAEIDAEVAGRPVADGDVLTACQAACPAEAIVFGDMNDGKSQVKEWKDSPLHYALLAGLNTQPRTTYLAALRNPTPDLEA